MNRLEEIQEMIKNFIYEKQQMRQEITELETKRNKIAQHRNEIKFVNGKSNEAFAQNARAEIVELGKQIAELGNQSQELQNKLNSRYIEVKKQVNIRIDNLISEGIREIRKIEEQRRDLQDTIVAFEARNAKYEAQKQEFLTRFGRIPELSADAEKDRKLQEQEYQHNKEIVAPINERIEKKEEELSELASYKRAFKNSNWSFIIKEEPKEENIVENVENDEINHIMEVSNVEDVTDEDDDSQNEIDALLTAVEEAISPLDLEMVEEEVQNIKTTEEESITLPLIENVAEQMESNSVITNIEENNAQGIEKSLFEDVKIENIEPLEEVEVEYIEPLEEIELEDIQSIEEISLEEIQPIQEIKVEETEPIQEVKVEEIANPEDIILEDIQPIEEIKLEDIKVEEENIQDIQVEEITERHIEKAEENKEDTIQIDTIENIKPNVENKNNNENSSKYEEEIITFEESLEKTREIPTLNGKVTLNNIIAKFEEKELVYKAQLSNGEEITIRPTKAKQGNLLLKYKENIEEIKEILINYAVAEYRPLDKKVIKKMDPIICEILSVFAKQYNYDAQSLIYNYAMSFSKYEEYEVDSIPNITYNVSYMEGTDLTKKEKEILAKICKNAKKNERIDIIGCNTGLSKIRYILKRTFNTNNANALPEGKY